MKPSNKALYDKAMSLSKDVWACMDCITCRSWIRRARSLLAPHVFVSYNEADRDEESFLDLVDHLSHDLAVRRGA